MVNHRDASALRWHDCRRWWDEQQECPYAFLDDEREDDDPPDREKQDPVAVSRRIPSIPKIPPRLRRGDHKDEHTRGGKTGGKERQKLYHGPGTGIPRAIQKELEDIFNPPVAPDPVEVPTIPPVRTPVPPSRQPVPIPIGKVTDAVNKKVRSTYPRWLERLDYPKALESIVSRSSSATAGNADPEDYRRHLPPPRTQESISTLGAAEARLATSLRGRPYAQAEAGASVRARRDTGRDVDTLNRRRLPGNLVPAAATAAAVAAGTGLIASGIRQSRGGGVRGSRVGGRGGAAGVNRPYNPASRGFGAFQF